MAEWPRAKVLPSAVSTADSFQDSVALGPIYPGEQIIPQKFGDVGDENSLSLTDGRMAISVELTDRYRMWWSYVPHFIGTPGYVYAYAYGQLLALSVYGRYLEEGESFVPRYIELLSAGGSRSPEELAAIAGLDLTDPEFWNKGLEHVRAQLERAEEAAAAVGSSG